MNKIASFVAVEAQGRLSTAIVTHDHLVPPSTMPRAATRGAPRVVVARDDAGPTRDLAGAIAPRRAMRSRRGVDAGDRVALLLRNSPQYVAAFYGVLAAGAVAVPLNVQERAERAGAADRALRRAPGARRSDASWSARRCATRSQAQA